MKIDKTKKIVITTLTTGIFLLYSNFKLNKINNIVHNKKNSTKNDIQRPIDIKEEVSLDKEYIKKLKYNKEIIEFINRIKNAFSKEQLKTLYNNLNSINIRKLTKLEEIQNKAFAIYDTELNEILIEPKDKHQSIYHELFHVATTKEKDNSIHCGFSQYINDSYFGNSINEGYTEIMTNRYFRDKRDINEAYKFEILLMSVIEDIVGKVKTEELYLNSDLYGLSQELKQYVSEDEFKEFIIDLDYYRTIVDEVPFNEDKLLHIKETILNIESFMFKLIYNKVTTDITKENERAKTKELYDYINKLKSDIKDNLSIYSFFDDDRVDEYIETFEKERHVKTKRMKT